MKGMIQTRHGWVPNDKFLWNSIADTIGKVDIRKMEFIYNKLYGTTWSIRKIEEIYAEIVDMA